MRAVTASYAVEGPAVEVEQLWYDKTRWGSWMDGFASVSKLDDHWPLEGSRRIWVTRPGGRGLIAETVTEYSAGAGQTLEVEDARVRGIQRVSFEPGGAVTRITLRLELDTKERLAPARRWWLRRDLRASLERSLARFAVELAAERELGD